MRSSLVAFSQSLEKKLLCTDANFAFTIRKDGSLWGVGREAMYEATDWKDNTTYTFYTNTTGVMGEDP